MPLIYEMRWLRINLKCCHIGICAAFAVLWLAVALNAAEIDATTKALLDEVMKGNEANLQKVQHGSARYRVTTQDPGKGEIGQPETEMVDVVFDYPRLRFDRVGRPRPGRVKTPPNQETSEPPQQTESTETVRHFIYDANQQIEYREPSIIEQRRRAASVNIKPVNPPFTTPAFHPRNQWYVARSVSVEITKWLKNAADDAEVTIAADKNDKGMITITFEHFNNRTIAIFSPRQGYGIVESKTWRKGFSEPSNTYEARYRDCGNNTFVIERELRQTFRGIAKEQARALNSRFEMELLELDLETIPEERVFTLAGLNIPDGVKVNDDVQRKKYLYARDDAGGSRN